MTQMAKKKKAVSLSALLAAILAVVTLFTSCENESSGFTSRPQDKMLYYESADGVTYLTSTDAGASTLGGNACGDMNRNAVPVGSGSAYYIDSEDGVLYYKSYLEPEYKICDNAESIFYSIGRIFMIPKAHDALYVVEETSQPELLIPNLGTNGGNRAIIESGNCLYVAGEGMLYRLIFGNNPEKLLKLEGEAVFLSDGEECVYFYANNAIYTLGSNSVAAKTLVSDVDEIIPMEAYYSGGEYIFYVKDSELCIYSIPKKKEIKTGIALPEGEAEGTLLPAETGKTEACAINCGDKAIVYLISEGGSYEAPRADWVWYSEGKLYGFAGESLIVCEKGAEAREIGNYSFIAGVSTLVGYYFTAGDSSDYNAVLYRLTDGRAELISENVYGASEPRAVYRYGGISFINREGMYIFDEESMKGELFAEHEGTVDFVTRNGGAFALYDDGVLEIMIYGEEYASTVAENVAKIYDVAYQPARLCLYPSSVN